MGVDNRWRSARAAGSRPRPLGPSYACHVSPNPIATPIPGTWARQSAAFLVVSTHHRGSLARDLFRLRGGFSPYQRPVDIDDSRYWALDQPWNRALAPGAELQVPGLRSDADKDAARKCVGRVMGKLFKEGNVVEVDAHHVERGERLVQWDNASDGGGFRSWTYTVREK